MGTRIGRDVYPHLWALSALMGAVRGTGEADVPSLPQREEVVREAEGYLAEWAPRCTLVLAGVVEDQEDLAELVYGTSVGRLVRSWLPDGLEEELFPIYRSRRRDSV